MASVNFGSNDSRNTSGSEISPNTNTYAYIFSHQKPVRKTNELFRPAASATDAPTTGPADGLGALNGLDLKGDFDTLDEPEPGFDLSGSDSDDDRLSELLAAEPGLLAESTAEANEPEPAPAPEVEPPRRKKEDVNHYPITDFYVESQSKRVRPASLKVYERILNLVFTEWERDYGVSVQEDQILGLNGRIIQTWANRSSGGRNHSTMNSYVSTLNAFFDWAYKMGALSENYRGLLRTQKRQDQYEPVDPAKEKLKYYTHEQVRSLMELVETKKGENWLRDRAIIALIIYSGLRQEEISNLKIKQVLSYGKGKIYCQRKGGKWELVNVGEQFYKYLDPYLEARAPYNEDDFLFTTQMGGTRFQPTGIYNMVTPCQKELGLPTGTHVLRHTFISEVEKTGGIAVARDCANHKMIRITNIYDHTTDAQRKRAVDKLNYFADEEAEGDQYGFPVENLDAEDRTHIEGILSTLAFGTESDRTALKERIKALYQTYVEIPGGAS